MIVLDASAVVDLLASADRETALVERVRVDGDLHAPHLVDIEVAQALRRLAASGSLSSDRATDALGDAALLPIVRYPHLALVERAWELRHTLGIYDGVYVALAEMLEVPLVTCDARIGRAPGHGATVEVFA
jgi:predicted nucleic acid-binding protein